MWKSTLFVALTLSLMMSLHVDALASQMARKDDRNDMTMMLFLMMFMNQNNQQPNVPHIIYAPMSQGHKGGYGGGMFGGYGYGSMY